MADYDSDDDVEMDLACGDCEDFVDCELRAEAEDLRIIEEEEEAEMEFNAAAAVCMAAASAGEPLFEGTGHRGRIPGSKTKIRLACTWYVEYVADNPIYNPHDFRQVFRLPLHLFWAFHNGIVAAEPLFQQRVNGLGNVGFTSEQKILAGLRRLATGRAYKDLDDSAKMSVEAMRSYFRLLIRTMKRVYGARYLNREPTTTELRRTVQGYAARGFPGCRGCVDCMHLSWKNCPLELKGQYKNPHCGKLATISCEGVCDSNLYCWSWYAGRCGTNNGKVVVANSPLFIELLTGKRPLTLPEGFVLNNTIRHWMLHFLGDGIYPRWGIFHGPNHSPQNDKEVFETKKQEDKRKDVERLFGCLQGRFKILRREWFKWNISFVVEVSECCVILHNMLVEMRLGGVLDDELDDNGQRVATEDLVQEFIEMPSSIEGSASASGFISTSGAGAAGTLDAAVMRLVGTTESVMDVDGHIRLNEALVEHSWAARGRQG